MKITKDFESPEAWNEEINKYKAGESVDIYARHSYPELEKREKQFAHMIGAPDTALFNAGMAAIHTAIEAQNLRPGDIVLCGENTYSQTGSIFEDLERRGVKTVYVDSSDKEKIEEAIAKFKPRLIIVESVANSQKMGVTDLNQLTTEVQKTNEEYKELNPIVLLDKILRTRKYSESLPKELKNELLTEIEEFNNGQNPFVFRNSIKMLVETGMERKEAIREIARLVKNVIENSREKLSVIVDNTLPSPILKNPLDYTKDRDIEMIIVESATKHFQEGRDKINAGIVYSNKSESIDNIKDWRSKLGTILQPTSEKEIPSDITEKMSEIVGKHAANALTLAEFFNQLREAGNQTILEVNHPNLKNHSQNELVQEIAPKGLVTLFYLKVKDASSLVEKIKEKAGDKIGIGASFGHRKTWFEPLPNDPQGLRISAGQEDENQIKELIEIIRNILQE